MNALILSALYVYPIKSLGGVSVPQVAVSSRGLEHDRRWMLIDADGRFLSQRENAEMALLQVDIEPEALLVWHKTKSVDPLRIPYPQNGHYDTQRLSVQVWDDKMVAETVSVEADAWFTQILGYPCRLVYMPDDSERLVDSTYALGHDLTSFSDGYPILVVGQSSLDLLNSKLEAPLPIDRFRPNLVFEGAPPHDEDRWYEFWVGLVQLYGVKPCARCVMTTIDQRTAEKNAEPLRTLYTYRKQGNKILFGQNVIPKTLGILKVGDAIEVMSRRGN